LFFHSFFNSTVWDCTTSDKLSIIIFLGALYNNLLLLRGLNKL
jgi:hypothetical protein